MNQVAIVEAIVEAARKRRLLDREPSRRLGQYALERGIASLEDLRSWIASADGVSPDLSKKLCSILAPPELPAFGPYNAFAHLADGGMGRVWLGAKERGPLVVIKTMKHTATGDAAADAERGRRFEREAKITSLLSHPNVVRCLDSGTQSDGTMYLVLEYVDSGDLRDLVEARHALPESLSLAIVHQVVDALSVAHVLKLIHRDIKPSNIFVGYDGKTLLADFGIARSTSIERTSLTMIGAIVGSPQYMSPEQVLSNRALDIRSDFYSLGAVLYYCLAGKPPFDGKVQDILHLHCHVPPPDIRGLKPAVSARTAILINQCLSKEPELRPADPAVLRTLIEQSLSGLGVTLREAFAEQGRSNPTVIQNIGGAPNNDRGEATLIADLSGRDNTNISIELATQTGSKASTMMQTLTASLLASEELRSKIEEDLAVKNDGGSGSGTDVGPEISTRKPDAELFQGDIDLGMSGDWVSLIPNDTSDPTIIMLFARIKIVLGKLKDPPIDICLRNYPVAQYKDVLNRISRQHIQLRYDRILQKCMAEDLGGTNGTLLDGGPLLKDTPRELSGKNAHVLIAATAVSLWVKCRKSRHPGQRVLLADVPCTEDAQCGLETDHAHDSVIITRPENRQEMAYAMVLRRLSIGGPGSDLPIAGARTLAAVMVARYANKWIWKTTIGKHWHPLCNGQELDCGGRVLIARPGEHNQF